MAFLRTSKQLQVPPIRQSQECPLQLNIPPELRWNAVTLQGAVRERNIYSLTSSDSWPQGTPQISRGEESRGADTNSTRGNMGEATVSVIGRGLRC